MFGANPTLSATFGVLLKCRDWRGAYIEKRKTIFFAATAGARKNWQERTVKRPTRLGASAEGVQSRNRPLIVGVVCRWDSTQSCGKYGRLALSRQHNCKFAPPRNAGTSAWTSRLPSSTLIPAAILDGSSLPPPWEHGGREECPSVDGRWSMVDHLRDRLRGLRRNNFENRRRTRGPNPSDTSCWGHRSTDSSSDGKSGS